MGMCSRAVGQRDVLLHPGAVQGGGWGSVPTLLLWAQCHRAPCPAHIMASWVSLQQSEPTAPLPCPALPWWALATAGFLRAACGPFAARATCAEGSPALPRCRTLLVVLRGSQDRKKSWETRPAPATPSMGPAPSLTLLAISMCPSLSRPHRSTPGVGCGGLSLTRQRTPRGSGDREAGPPQSVPPPPSAGESPGAGGHCPGRGSALTLALPPGHA